ncbi:MAG: crossover junction endodeoxyribonuclease RuvC [Bacteroidetes bacterium]|nr:crossover junction endodeoxyribonuclease RuvC [Bacteroidota bacterium]
MPNAIKTDKIIMGIDPGTVVLGYGLIHLKDKELIMLAAGSIKLDKFSDQSIRLMIIFERLTQIIDEYHPDEMAIEAPFFGKNVQSMLKLGRAQGVAIAAALSRDIPYVEYAPRRIKQAVTGNGAASKEQVAAMLQHVMKDFQMPKEMDATDGLAAAICHHYSSSGRIGSTSGSKKGWAGFIKQNPDRIKD